MSVDSNKTYLGIDVGGTNVKFGIVSQQGEMLHKEKIPTKELREGGNFPVKFVAAIDHFLKDHPEIDEIGMGVPGTINKERTTTIDLPNIPSFSNTNIIELLSVKFPSKKFFLENDANAAALGEYYFSENKLPENYLFLTLGTGVGGAAIIDHKIFKGGEGNGMEVGHIFATSKDTVEQLIGKKGIVAATYKILTKEATTKSKLRKIEGEIIAKDVVKAAKKGDKLALKVFSKFGSVLGRCIVSSIRTLDLHTVIIGGGVSDTFDFIKDPMYEVINANLPEYYTKSLDVKLASLGNDAGILGAASLCMQD